MTGCKTTSVWMMVPARAMRAMRATAATAAAAVAADFAKRAILDVNHISHTGRPIFRLAVNSAKTCASALGYSPGAGLTHRRSLLAGPVCTASLLDPKFAQEHDAHISFGHSARIQQPAPARGWMPGRLPGRQPARAHASNKNRRAHPARSQNSDRACTHSVGFMHARVDGCPRM